MKNLAKKIAMFKQVDIYPVISSEFTHNRSVIDVLQQIAAGGAKIVQLREKNLTKAAIYQLAVEYRKITTANNMLLIINDHLDIALAVKADGVHLGQDDLPLKVARGLTDQLILGSSTHNLAEARQAIAAGADYINIGPIYSTQTKQLSYESLGLETLRQISTQIDIPFSVMGGIKEDHLDQLIGVGATHIAMVTEITQSPDICSRVKQLRRHWQNSQ
jgi:thiamine-phosphate pyrophosphorylase